MAECVVVAVGLISLAGAMVWAFRQFVAICRSHIQACETLLNCYDDEQIRRLLHRTRRELTAWRILGLDWLWRVRG